MINFLIIVPIVAMVLIMAWASNDQNDRLVVWLSKVIPQKASAYTRIFVIRSSFPILALLCGYLGFPRHLYRMACR